MNLFDDVSSNPLYSAQQQEGYYEADKVTLNHDECSKDGASSSFSVNCAMIIVAALYLFTRK